jgi:hypothetical protein
MKANVNWVYPKGVSEGDLYDFTIKNQVSLPLLSPHESSKETTYLEGGNVKGTPVLAQLQQDGQKKTLEGVLVKDVEGIFLIPKEFVAKAVVPLIDAVEASAETALETAEDITKEAVKESVADKKVLGFTKKQLLAIGIAMLVVTKLAK